MIKLSDVKNEEFNDELLVLLLIWEMVRFSNYCLKLEFAFICVI